MAFFKPPANTLEHAVKAIVSKNYPQAATRGLINVSIGAATSATTNVISDREGLDENSKELFIWGTSMWGGAKVVSQR